VGDFNGDGKLDLATANYSNGGNGTVSILLGNGAGNFTLASSPGTGKGPVSVAVGDFNGDGRLDFVTANYSDNTASVLLQAPLAAAGPQTGLNFGSQPINTTSGPMTATLTNNGSAPLTVTGVSASSGFGTSTNCVGTLQPGDHCNESVTFSPTTTGPTSGAVLTFTDNSGNVAGSTQTVPLSGTGTDVDLTATKSDTVGHNTKLGNHWTWKIVVANIGTTEATFSSTQTILKRHQR
jgi:hypothetical protein